MKPGDVLHEEDRRVGAVAQRDELRALLRLGREEDAVVGHDADRVAAEGRPAAHQLGAVGLLELLEAGAVDDAGEDLAHVEGHPHVHRRDAEQLLGRVERLVGRSTGGAGAEPPPVQVGDDAAGDADRVGLVAGQVVAQARDPGVHARPAQLLLVGLLADRHLHQRRPAQEDAGPVLDHDRVVAHAGEVGPAGGRRAEHHADGGDALRRELGQAAELLAPGDEHVGLAGQVGPSGLDQEQQREAVLLGHVHGAQQLADRGRARRPAAHGRVVGDDEALGVRHLGQRHHDAAADRVARVQPGERAQLEHRGAGVDQRLEALAHHHLAAGAVALHVLRPAAGQHLVVQGAHLVDQRAHGLGVVSELVARDGQARPDGPCSCGGVPRGPALLQEGVHPLGRLGAGEELGRGGRGGRQPVGPRLRGQGAQQRLGGAHRAGRGLADGLGLCGDPGVERGLVVDDRREQPGGGRLAGARSARRSGSRGSRKRRSTTRSAGTRIMAGATPTRTSVKANVLASAATAMSAAAMSPSPPARACPLTRAMTGTGLSTMEVRMSGMRFGAAAPRSERSAPEQNTVPAPVRTTARTLGVAAWRHATPASSCVEQMGRERVAVGGRVERQGADAVVVLHADQRIRHGCAV